MKRFKFLAVAALLVSALAVTFAFTTNSQSETKRAARIFKFVGSTASTSSLINPANWIETTATASDHTPNFVSDLVISADADQDTYIYSTGPNADKPKVDNTSLQLRADVLLAGGHGTPSGVQEVSQTDYQILVNSTQRN